MHPAGSSAAGSSVAGSSAAGALDLWGLLQTLPPPLIPVFLEALLAMYWAGMRQGTAVPVPGARPPVSPPAPPVPAPIPPVTAPAPPVPAPPAPAPQPEHAPAPQPDRPPVVRPQAADIPPLPADARVVEPDLSGDAAAALQAAIDALGPDGGVVKLPPGTFRLDRPISLRSNVHVAGTSGETVLESRAERGVFLNFDSTHTSIRGLVIDGQGVAQRGMFAGRAREVGIYDCEIRNLPNSSGWATGMGIYFESEVTDAKIIGNHIHDLGGDGKDAKGILMGKGSNNVQISHNTIENVDRNGIFAYDGCKDLYIGHNRITNVRGLGITIEVFEHNTAVVEHNEVAGWISFDTSAGVIRNNVVDGEWAPQEPTYGIEVVKGDGVQVVGNTVRHVNHGLSVVGTERSLFQDNLVEDVEWGSQVYGEDTRSHGNRYVGNVFRGRGIGYGLFLNGQGDHAHLEGNTVEGFRHNFSTNATDRSTLTLVNNTGF